MYRIYIVENDRGISEGISAVLSGWGILSGVALYKLAGLHLASDDKSENSSTFKDKFD